jgi:hypothetical protein
VSELADAIREKRSRLVLDGLHLMAFPSGVINVSGREREVMQADLETIRAAIAEAGFTEVESWLPRQGVSWLSEGVSAGVSFRLVPTELDDAKVDVRCRHCGVDIEQGMGNVWYEVGSLDPELCLTVSGHSPRG